MYVAPSQLQICGDRILAKPASWSVGSRVVTPASSEAYMLLEIVAIGEGVNRDLPQGVAPYAIGEIIVGDRYAAKPCRLLESEGSLVQQEYYILTRAEVVARVKNRSEQA